MQYKFVIILLGIIISNNCQSQNLFNTQLPEVGKPMPYFELNDVHHYAKSKVSLNDFKGKWLFLDFWYRGCAASVKNLAQVSKWQKKFKDKIDYLIVGVNSKAVFGDGIDILYEKLCERQNLELPIAYDSTLQRQWNIWSFPYIIIVDPNGIVKTITGGLDMTTEKLSDMIQNKTVSFYPKILDRPEFEPSKVADSDILYRSIITKWKGEFMMSPDIEFYMENVSKNGFKVVGEPLHRLYLLAYFGKGFWSTRDPFYKMIYPQPILEIKNKDAFDHIYAEGKAMYNYELVLSSDNSETKNIMKIMQNDLRNTFGYEVTIEDRLMPVWSLIALPGAEQKLLASMVIPVAANSDGVGNVNGDGGAAGFTYRNYPMEAVVNSIFRYLYNDEVPLIDETGISYNVDIVMDALMTDRSQVIKELRKYNLDLVKSKRLMKVLIIRDQK